MARKNCIVCRHGVKPLYTALNAGFILYIPSLFRPPHANPVADALHIGLAVYGINFTNKVVCVHFVSMHYYGYFIVVCFI